MLLVRFLFSVFLAIVFLLIVVLLESRKAAITLNTRKRRGDERDLKRFCTDVKFDEFPSDFEASNEHDCNAKSQRKCKLDDAQTLFGCKELNVRCQHFDEETTYKENDQVYTFHPNTDPNEGYALPIAMRAEYCNTNHGDWVLVASNENDRDYFLICRCKREGLIGNDTILGNCTTLHICNGKVKNINVPFEELECVCPPGEISRWSGKLAPTCQHLTVNEANSMYDNWSFLLNFGTRSTLPTSRFSVTIRDNIRVDYLLSPCSNSLIDDSPINYSSYDPFRNTCVFYDNGIPIRTGLLQKSDEQMKREKGSFRDKLTTLSMLDGVLPTSSVYASVYASDHVLNKRQILAVKATADWLPRNEYARIVVGTDIGFASNGNIFMGNMARRIESGYCVKAWIVTYSCRMYPIKVYGETSGNLPLIEHTESNPWGNDDWIQAEGICEKFRDLGYGVENNPSETQSYGNKLRLWGIEYRRDHEHNHILGGIVNEDTWKRYRQLLDELDS